jgi:hypothetical protein
MRSDATKRASRRASVFESKSQLALEIVQAPPQWSALWSGWGRCGIRSGTGFLFALADASCIFLIDVHKSFVIYQLDPQPTIAQPTSKGRKATRALGLDAARGREGCARCPSRQRPAQGHPGPGQSHTTVPPGSERTEESQCRGVREIVFHEDWRIYDVRETTRAHSNTVSYAKACMCGTRRTSVRAAMNFWSLRIWMAKEVFIDEPNSIDLHAASELDAEATLLGRALL